MKLRRTLILTSPLMKGSDVEHVQRVLNGANFLKKDFYGGKVDGECGPITLHAAEQAKYWLGAPESELLPIYGQRIENLLIGKTTLPGAWVKRRAQRIKAYADSQKAGAAQPQRVKALNAMLKHKGETERPAGSNNFPWATDWYGFDAAWCAMGVSRAYVIAGSKWFKAGARYAYVPFMVNDARAGNGLRVVSFAHALPGDPVAFNWDGDWDADHVGLFKRKLSATTFETVECNTSSDDSGDQSNGGGVFVRERSVAQVQHFIRVKT